MPKHTPPQEIENPFDRVDLTLPRSYQELALVMDSIPVLVSYFDREHRFRFANQTYEQWFGIKRDELVGQTLSAVLGDETYEEIKPFLDRALTGERVSHEISIDYKGQSRRLIRIDYVPHEVETQVRGVFALVLDLTEQSESRQALIDSEQRYRRLVETSNVIPWEAEASTGQMTYVGPQAEAILGYGIQEWYEVAFWPTHIHPDDTEWVIQFCKESWPTTPFYEFEYRMISKDGRVVWLRDIVNVVKREGQEPLLQGFMFDITDRKKTEDDLRRSEERYRTLVGAMTSVVWTMGPDGKFISPQYSWAMYTGQHWEKHVGWGWLDVIHPEDRSRIEETWKKSVKETRVFQTEGRIWSDAHGQYRYFISRAVPLRNQDGSIQEWVGTISDVHDRRMVEESLVESEQRFRLMADAAPVLIWTTGPDRKRTFFNKPWLTFTGRPSLEEAGNQWLDSIHPDDRSRYEAALNTSFDMRKELRHEYRLKHHNGSYRWMLEHAVPRFSSDGTFTGYIGSSVDINDQKETESQVRTLNEELEQRVKNRTVQLETANRELKNEIEVRESTEHELELQAHKLARSNEELSQFAYVASHDLREPLRMVKSYTQLLAKRMKDKQEPETQEFVSFIVEGVNRMNKLIEDLLAYSRVGRSEIVFEPTNLNVVIDQVLTDVNPMLKEAGAVVERSQLPTVDASPSQMRQLFQNLIGNALKFRGEKPPVIRISGACEENECVVSIQDNGIGIEASYFERIFVIFQRLHTRDEYPGTGIGLAVCKKIVQRHGGRIWVESKPGEGSTFKFSLPLKERRKSIEGRQPPDSA